jgi:biotin synthase-related radical SAM superfamily protein
VSRWEWKEERINEIYISTYTRQGENLLRGLLRLCLGRLAEGRAGCNYLVLHVRLDFQLSYPAGLCFTSVDCSEYHLLGEDDTDVVEQQSPEAQTAADRYCPTEN